MRTLVALMVLVLGACSGKRAPHEEPPTGGTGYAVIPARDAGAVDANPLASVFGGPAKGPSNADTIAQMKEKEATASPAEKVLIEKMIAALRELDLATTDTAHERDHEIAGTKLMLDALRASMDYSKTDVATMRTLISSYAMTSHQAENMGIGDAIDIAAIRRESLERGRALVKAFPKDPRAWKLLGFLEGSYGGEPDGALAAMRAYQTCAKLDPALADCAKSLASHREAWTVPYCDAADIKVLIGWYEEGADVPRFTSKDVVRLEAQVIHMTGGNVYDGTTGQVIDKAPDRDDAIVSMELAPAAVKQELVWEREVQARKHDFEIRVGGKTVATTKGTYSIPEERTHWAAHGVTIDEMCGNVKRRPLPPDLR